MANKMVLKQLFNVDADKAKDFEKKTFVGIDFGTSTSVVTIATFNNEDGEIKTECLKLPQECIDGTTVHQELFPTVIAQLEDKLLVGQGAFDLKVDSRFTSGVNLWHSFKMELGTDLGPKWYESKCPNIKSPKDAAFFFFKYLKTVVMMTCLQRNFNTNVHYVVSIPASFESNQRADLIEALAANDIPVSGYTLIDEPNAAFLGYMNSQNKNSTQIELSEEYNPKLLVFDFGAGTCDISILELSADYNGMKVKNISISQFTELGGNDIDYYIADEFLLPKFLKKNNCNEEDFTTEVIDLVRSQLMGIAEQLKIKACKDFEYILTDPDAKRVLDGNHQGVTINKKLLLSPKGMEMSQETWFMSYNEFIQTINFFMDSSRLSYGTKKGKKNSIAATIDSAIKKAKINKNEVDYVLMIGGSSKNPFVQKRIKQYFSQYTTVLIPDDLQELVSQGAALHCMLMNGFGITMVRPITSEPIKILLKDNNEFTVIPAGKEIPFSPIKINGFNTGNTRKHKIEIPVCVSTMDKMLTNICISSPYNLPFLENTPVELTMEMNADKVLKIKAKIMDQECDVKNENPFSNTYLTDSEMKVLKAQRKSNISAAKNNGRPTRAALIELKDAYEDAGQDLYAAETLQKQIELYGEDEQYNYLGVLYHNAGERNKAIECFKRSIEKDPEHRHAWSNLGHDLYLVGDFDNAKICLRKALEIFQDNITALSVMGNIHRDEGYVEEAQKYYQRAFNILIGKYNDKTIFHWEKTWLASLCDTLKKTELAIEVRNSYNKAEDSSKYNEENLIDVDTDSPICIYHRNAFMNGE